jgi:hypothetical protein
MQPVMARSQPTNGRSATPADINRNAQPTSSECAISDCTLRTGLHIDEQLGTRAKPPPSLGYTGCCNPLSGTKFRSSRASSTRLSAQPEGTIRVTLRCPRAAKSSTKGRDLCVGLPLRACRFLGTTLLPPSSAQPGEGHFLHRYRLR